MKLILIGAFLFLSFSSYGERIQLLKGINRNASDYKLTISSPKQSFTGEYEGSILIETPYLDVNKTKNAEFYEYSLPQESMTQDEKMAQIPFDTVLVNLAPGDFEVQSELGEETFVPYKASFSPKMPCRCSDDPIDFNFDGNIYEKDERKNFQVEYLGDFKGTPLTRLIFYPAKIDSNKNGMIVNSLSRYKIKSSNKNFSIFKNINQLLGKSPKTNRFLFLTPRKFLKTLDTLVSWKRSLGFKPSVFVLEDIGNEFTKIQTFFKDEYKKSPYDYAILVGHEEVLATDFVDTSNDSQTPSDLKYFTMGGDDDYIPDVYYGRMAVDNELELRREIKKIMDFEQFNWSTTTTPLTHIGIASNEGSDPTDVEYIRSMISPMEKKLGLKRIEFLQENTNSNVENINKALNKGAVWMNYIGHGSGTSWPSINKGDYRSEDIKSLLPGKILPIIIDVACQNGRFSYEGRLGERFMNEESSLGPIGAVAYFGGSVDISWHPPAKMAVYINEIVASKTVHILGEALLAGQLELYEKHSNKNEVKDNFIWYHLQGDPSLRLPW